MFLTMFVAIALQILNDYHHPETKQGIIWFS